MGPVRILYGSCANNIYDIILAILYEKLNVTYMGFELQKGHISYGPWELVKCKVLLFCQDLYLNLNDHKRLEQQ